MKTCIAATLAVALFVVSAPAEEKAPTATETAIKQELLARRFREFEQTLLRLAQRLERSSKTEDRDRAAQLRRALDVISREGIDTRFDKLVSVLKNSQAGDIQEVKDVIRESEHLVKNLQDVLAALVTNDQLAKIQAERARLLNLARELDRLIRDTKIVRHQTETGKMGPAALGKSQDKVTKATEDVAKDLEQAGQPQAVKPLVQNAAQNQRSAGQNIGNGNPDRAAREQDRAIDLLTRARAELEKILAQLRTEELKQLLASLRARCERMLAQQTAVRDGTVKIDKAVAADRKLTRPQEQASLNLSDQEKEITREADKAVALVKADGTTVAFAEVLAQIQADTQLITRRLGRADIGVVTQGVEQSVIDTLQEIIDALKEAEAKILADPGPDGPRRPRGVPRDPKMFEDVQELKMIRAMQVRVNQRTQAYAGQYQGEQADAPDIRLELKTLAERQEQILKAARFFGQERNP